MADKPVALPAFTVVTTSGRPCLSIRRPLSTGIVLGETTSLRIWRSYCCIGCLFDMSSRFSWWFTTFNVFKEGKPIAGLRQQRSIRELSVCTYVAIPAAFNQIPPDVVLSEGIGLSHWPIKRLWPLSQVEFVFPMKPWGDPGPTLIFCFGMIVAAKFQRDLRIVSVSRLGLVTAYIAIRGFRLSTL